MPIINSNPANKITAIILAAGLGSRFGGDKLIRLIPYTDNTLLPIGLISALNVKPYVDRVICVVRPSDIQLKQAFLDHDFTIVENIDFNMGLSSSIKAGINASISDSHYMICLGDMPYITPSTYQTIINYFSNTLSHENSCIVRPILKGNKNPGHPVIFSHDLKSNLSSLTGDEGGKTIIKQHGVNLIEVDDSGTLADIDYIEDIRK